MTADELAEATREWDDPNYHPKPSKPSRSEKAQMDAFMKKLKKKLR